MRAAGWAILALLGQERNEAEELFRRMEEKLLKAKTLSFKATTAVEGEKLGRGRLEGSLTLETPRKIRTELEGQLGEERKIRLVADGKNVKWFLTGFGDNSGSAPEKLGANVLHFLTRANLFDGIYMGAALEWAEGSHDAGARLKVSGFKMGAKESVGGVEAQKIEYRLEAPDLKAAYGVELWIDPKLLAPVKRVLTTAGSPPGRITETYSGYKVDEKVEPSLFEIPK